jgi:hypothetical protein
MAEMIFWGQADAENIDVIGKALMDYGEMVNE